jgi:hypothetical protein
VPERPKWPIIIMSMLVILFLAYRFYFVTVVNPLVVEELYADPQGTKATPVMLLGLPDGKRWHVLFHAPAHRAGFLRTQKYLVKA